MSSASRRPSSIARRRSSNAVSTSFRSALASSPIALRSAAGTAFSWLRIALSSPFLPRMVAFSLRSACSVVAPSNRPRNVARKVSSERAIGESAGFIAWRTP